MSKVGGEVKLFVFNKLSQMDVGMNVYVVLYYRCTLMGSAQASSDSSTAAVAAAAAAVAAAAAAKTCLLYTSPSPRDGLLSRMPSSA